MLPSIPQRSRIDVIDALRGFTLFGIIIAHMTEQYYAGPFPQAINDANQLSVLDYIVSGFVGIFISGKFFMIFSFLFGLSFYIQLRNGSGDWAFIRKFSWRIILLFIIGIVHHLHYRGDILSIYAILGFGLLLTYRLPDRYILFIGALLVVDVPGILSRVYDLTLGGAKMNDFIKQDQVALLRYYETFKHGTYADLMKENLLSFKTKMEYQVWSGRLYITMGLFLLGYYAGKMNFFENLSEKVSIVKKYLKYAAWLLGSIFLVTVAFFVIGNDVTGGLPENINISAFLSFADLLNACLAVIYVAGFVLLFEKAKWRNRLMVFYEAGRMGLTTYLMQTVFGILIFSTLGLGLVTDFNAAVSFLIAIILFVLQIAISKFWMLHFYYGPVEWLWRTLTNFKLELFRRKTVPVLD